MKRIMVTFKRDRASHVTVAGLKCAGRDAQSLHTRGLYTTSQPAALSAVHVPEMEPFDAHIGDGATVAHISDNLEPRATAAAINRSSCSEAFESEVLVDCCCIAASFCAAPEVPCIAVSLSLARQPHL